MLLGHDGRNHVVCSQPGQKESGGRIDHPVALVAIDVFDLVVQKRVHQILDLLLVPLVLPAEEVHAKRVLLDQHSQQKDVLEGAHLDVRRHRQQLRLLLEVLQQVRYHLPDRVVNELLEIDVRYNV